jgi:DNA-binding CsgD family transcriptional regulator
MGALVSAVRARKAVELIRESFELGAATEPARQHIVESLRGLVGAEVVACVKDTSFGVGLRGGITQVTLAGFETGTAAVFSTHQEFGSDFNPYIQRMMPLVTRVPVNTVTTLADQEVLERSAWNDSTWVNEYVRPARLDRFLGSMRLVGQHSAHGFGLMRSAGSTPFTEEDREVMQLVHLGLGDVCPRASMRETLAPRVQQTLDALLDGACDKDIASRLGISPHTVRQYVKTIFKAYGVSSRLELAARVLK